MKLSILDLAHVPMGSDVGQALRNTLDLARRVDTLGYERFWLAEHHNMPGIASAATAVVIGQVAAATQRIRVGSGGIMLPNHAPLVIAEQFGTLEALFPGRIDLGLGRAPGTDGLTWRALRRDVRAAEHFPDDVLELQALLGPVQPGQRIRAVPGADSNVPLWILGSSLFGSQLAARLGLPYAFASHFAPAALHEALRVYREMFQPSAQLQTSYAMAGVNVICAATDEEAQLLFTSLQRVVIGLVTGSPGRLSPPAPIDPLPPHVQQAVEGFLGCSFVGSPATVRAGLEQFIQDTGADELIVASAIFDHAARLQSYELLSRECLSR
ncbi:MAG TPA: LLM class flavin-dependent oxidoreductase [Steroidobacteraceae bacterium]|nr:LLM class flavin-dependent oxidoreductase [Steroidobacteraceae bacterium]